MNATEQAVRAIANRIAAYGYMARVQDHESVLQGRTYDAREIADAILSVDECFVNVWDGDRCIGSLYLVLNYDDPDIVCDCTNEPEILRLADLA
jgi:hypothetical protein